MPRLPLAPVLLALSLGACATSPATDTSKAIARTDVATAMRAFVGLCYTTAPSFAGVPDLAEANGYVYIPATQSYFHPDRGISVKIIEGKEKRVCSLSFVTDEPARVFEAKMKDPFNARKITMPSVGLVYAARIAEGGVFVASLGTKVGTLTQYELVNQQPK